MVHIIQAKRFPLSCHDTAFRSSEMTYHSLNRLVQLLDDIAFFPCDTAKRVLFIAWKQTDETDNLETCRVESVIADPRAFVCRRHALAWWSRDSKKKLSMYNTRTRCASPSTNTFLLTTISRAFSVSQSILKPIKPTITTQP